MDFEIIIKFITGGLNHDPTTPTLDKVINSNLVFIIFLSLILIALIVGKYGLGMKMLGKKKAWKAIIPVYGLMLLFRAVDLNPYFAIATIIPGIGIIPYAIFSFLIPKAFAQKSDMQILSIFFPYVTFNMLGFDKKYEYQYVKGKNVAFKNEFRTVMPEDLAKDALTPASAVNGAAVSSIAQESAISRAASAAAEQNRLIIEEQEKAAAVEEAKKKAEEEAKKKEASRAKTEDYKYDIFSSEKDNGPESASLNISFNIVNGKFKSVGMAPAMPPKPVVPVAPATPTISPAKPAEPIIPAQPMPVQPAPIQQPTAPAAMPVAQPAPAAPAVPQTAPVAPVAPQAAPVTPAAQPAPVVMPTSAPIQQPTAPAAMPVAQPAPVAQPVPVASAAPQVTPVTPVAQPAPVVPTAPTQPASGIQMTAVPPTAA